VLRQLEIVSLVYWQKIVLYTVEVILYSMCLGKFKRSVERSSVLSRPACKITKRRRGRRGVASNVIGWRRGCNSKDCRRVRPIEISSTQCKSGEYGGGGPYGLYFWVDGSIPLDMVRVRSRGGSAVNGPQLVKILKSDYSLENYVDIAPRRV
jgi:hypothetical protein